MNATRLNEMLIRLNACAEGVEYAQGKTLKEAWGTCTRPDWMLWLAWKVGADRKRLVRAACACARTALPYVANGDARPRIAIEVAEAWCRGDVGIEEVRAAAADAAAYAAYAAAYAAYAAAYAAACAACAADAAADAARAAARAAGAACAAGAAYSVARAAARAARAAGAAYVADAAMAPLVRAHLDADYIERLLEAL